MCYEMKTLSLPSILLIYISYFLLREAVYSNSMKADECDVTFNHAITFNVNHALRKTCLQTRAHCVELDILRRDCLYFRSVRHS